MPEETSTQDLKEPLALIESIIAAARRSTESWGWVFLLWGVAFYVAIGWATWGPSLWVWGSRTLAWPATVIAASSVTLVVARRTGRGQPRTFLSRAIVSVWVAVGISMFVLLFALGLTGSLATQLFMGIMAAMLGTANAASSMILRWRAQFACTVVWWTTCWACVQGSETQALAALLIAIFLCQIAFGVYVMTLESRRRRQSGVVHA